MNGERFSVPMLYSDELADITFDLGCCMDQIFNTDENDLNYKMLPSKFSTVKADREAPGTKKCEEHVTSNAHECI